MSFKINIELLLILKKMTPSYFTFELTQQFDFNYTAVANYYGQLTTSLTLVFLSLNI